MTFHKVTDLKHSGTVPLPATFFHTECVEQTRPKIGTSSHARAVDLKTESLGVYGGPW